MHHLVTLSFLVSALWLSVVAFHSLSTRTLHLSHLSHLEPLPFSISLSRLLVFVLCLTIFFLGRIVPDALTDYNYEGF